jgi:hypothetical protein
VKILLANSEKADIPVALSDVRFRVNSGHWLDALNPLSRRSLGSGHSIARSRSRRISQGILDLVVQVPWTSSPIELKRSRTGSARKLSARMNVVRWLANGVFFSMKIAAWLSGTRFFIKSVHERSA